jgi:hypothetical protein
MLAAEKRKLSTSNKQKNVSVANSMESGIESDFTGDFSLPPVKRKVLGTRQVSFSVSHNSGEFQTSSGFGSLLSSSSLSPHKSLGGTPKKRKSETTDENAFYNSYQFVSPLKIRKTDEKRAKLILKEKCSSENVILSSTPIRNSNRNKIWGKFRSYHPEKLDLGRSSEFQSLEEASPENWSLNLSGSFNLSEDHSKDSPIGGLQQLLRGPLDLNSIPKQQPIETVTQSQGNLSASSSASSNRTFFYCGRLKLDILKKLHEQNNLALGLILNHLDDKDLLSLSHVSKDYRNMIKSNKTLDQKRQNYLKAFRKVKENTVPGNQTLPAKWKPEKKKQGKFGDVNVNHSMQLRPKPQSPPVSPSNRKWNDNQKVSSRLAGVL